MYINNKTDYVVGIILFICLILIIYGSRKNTPSDEEECNGIKNTDDLRLIEEKNEDTITNEPPLSFSETLINYALPQHWLIQPDVIDQEVDVFYLYPTAYKMTKDNQAKICQINNKMMLQNALNAFELQASIFKGLTNIYAPLYRQVDGQYLLSLPIDHQQKIISKVPTQDVVNAFDYYIKYLNKGRPFILAGHSQGSNVLLYLLSDYMRENKEVYERMIAAYVIGYSVTETYLGHNPHLKFAQGPDDVGVIISYNTEAPNVVEKNPVVLPGALVINPITWTLDEKTAPKEVNLGSYLPDDKGLLDKILNYADATVNKSRGVLVCSTASVEKFSTDFEIFPHGNFHYADYPFYYFNLRENVANRIKFFLFKQLEGILQLF